MINKKHTDRYNSESSTSYADGRDTLPRFSSVFDLTILIVIAILLFLGLIFIAKIFIVVFLCVYVGTWIYNKFIKK